MIAEIIFKSVGEEERYILLQDGEEMTPVHWACFHGNTMFELMVRLTTEETWYKLLQIRSASEGKTPLHMSGSALSNQTQAIKAVADSLISLRLAHILKITDDKGLTPLQFAERYCSKAVADLLQDYQTKALIHVALQQTDETGTNIRLQI